MARCHYCRDTFPKQTNLDRHRLRNPQCRRAWTKDLHKAAQRAFGFGQDVESKTNTSDDESYMESPAPEEPSEPVVDNDGDYSMGEVPSKEPALPDAMLPSTLRRTTVEDVDDMGDPPYTSSQSDSVSWEEFHESFPAEFEAGAEIDHGEIPFEKIRRQQEEAGESRWAGFADGVEWEMAKWMVQSIGQNDMEKFLKLAAVSCCSVNVLSVDLHLISRSVQELSHPSIIRHHFSRK